MFRLLEPWRTRLLWLSLGVNLFLAALLAGPMVWRRPPPGTPNFTILVERMARHLPPQDAALLRDRMNADAGWFDKSREQLDAARARVGDAVAATPYAPEAVRAALSAMQDQLRQGAMRFDDSLVQAVGQLSPEGRAKLAAVLKRRRP